MTIFCFVMKLAVHKDEKTNKVRRTNKQQHLKKPIPDKKKSATPEKSPSNGGVKEKSPPKVNQLDNYNKSTDDDATPPSGGEKEKSSLNDGEKEKSPANVNQFDNSNKSTDDKTTPEILPPSGGMKEKSPPQVNRFDDSNNSTDDDMPLAVRAQRASVSCDSKSINDDDDVPLSKLFNTSNIEAMVPSDLQPRKCVILLKPMKLPDGFSIQELDINDSSLDTDSDATVAVDFDALDNL